MFTLILAAHASSLCSFQESQESRRMEACATEYQRSYAALRINRDNVKSYEIV